MSQQPARQQLSRQGERDDLNLLSHARGPSSDVAVCTAESFGASVKGRGRHENQDRFLTATFGRWAHVESGNLADAQRGKGDDVLTAGQGQLMMVADGMGGHQHGALASQVVVDSLFSHLVTRSNWAAQPALNADHVLEDLRHAMEHAQRRLAWAALREQLGASQVGTTALVGVIAWPLLLLAHAGDCRCYLQRDGQIHCLTKDHTVGQEGRDLGHSVEQTKRFDPILTSAITNVAKTPRIDLEKVALQEDDVVVMCSNGVWANVSEETLGQAALATRSPQDICETVLASAINNTEDDATVVVTKIVRAC